MPFVNHLRGRRGKPWRRVRGRVNHGAWIGLLCFVALAFAPAAGRAYGQNGPPKIDTVVVCASELLQASRPWLEYRRKQGHQIALLTGDDSADETLRAIRAIASRGSLRSVVLIGDVGPDGLGGPHHVATHRVEATVIQQWGAEPTFASDNAYGDLNKDGIPELAVGRICANTPSELTTIVSKILEYEQADVRDWRRRVNFVAGVGGFGLVADTILESAAKKFITEGIPPEYRTSMTQASWRSPYSPDPRRFQATTIERLNEGCLAWVYLGHGQVHELDYYRVPGGGLPILSVEDVPQIDVREGLPIAVFLSCYAGAFDAESDCLAEKLLAARSGPVAVIAGSSVTMPYAMTIMANAMMSELFEKRRATLGEVCLAAKQELGKPPATGAERTLLDQLATAISPRPDQLSDERTEHIQVFHLLGDPLLRLRYPSEVQVHVPEYGVAGQELTVACETKVAGRAIVELVCRRDRLTFKPPKRPSFEPTNAWLRELDATYAKANDTVWEKSELEVSPGKFMCRLPIPAEGLGPAHVRVFVQGETDYAMGATDIYLRREDREAVAVQSTLPTTRDENPEHN